MKGSHKYVLFITVFVLVCFALGQRMPRRFVWEASFSHNDRQPFGCYVFDSIMTESMPRGYAVLRKTFTQINNDKKMRNSNLLVLCDLMSLNAIDLRSMDSLLLLCFSRPMPEPTQPLPTTMACHTMVASILTWRTLKIFFVE